MRSNFVFLNCNFVVNFHCVNFEYTHIHLKPIHTIENGISIELSILNIQKVPTNFFQLFFFSQYKQRMIENLAVFVSCQTYSATYLQKKCQCFFYELDSCFPSSSLVRTPKSPSFFLEMSFLIEFRVEFARSDI